MPAALRGHPLVGDLMNFKSKLWLSFAFLGMLALVLPGVARADAIVTVGGTTYDITTLSGTFSGNSATLEGTPWWGNATLAESLSNAVGTALGTQLPPNETLGPLFATSLLGSAFDEGSSFDQTLGTSIDTSTIRSQTFLYATGSVVPSAAAPEPSTLSLMIAAMLGLGLLVGAKRYRGNHLSSEV